MLDNKLVFDFIGILHNYKANDIISFNQIGKVKLSDVVIVASCESNKQAQAAAMGIIAFMKKHEIEYHAEGLKEGNWVVVDMFDIMVHVFRTDVRSYYSIDDFIVNG